MNTEKFSGKGAVYAESRPAYPQAFIDYLYTDIGITPDSIIADIGSGTGILTRQLLEKGSKVFAVESNADMRANAQSALSRFDNFTSVNGTAENTTLDGHSVDFVTVATAFHWFDRQTFKAECKRILKDGGKVIIVYNSRDEESSLVKKFYEVNREFCPKFKGFTGSGTLLRPENLGHYNTFFSGEYIVKIIDNNLTYDEQGFIGRSLSSSYAPKENDENYSAYVKALRLFFQEYSENGTLIMPNVTHSYIGKV
ncbi:MAG: class I SAM-dependent methyltransferase [Oscillospiraceae bacterium]|nr:class I SAM-dependent methyltransferase [Oscillospiraceae bacterium]